MSCKWGIGLGDSKRYLEIWRDGFVAPVLRLIKANNKRFEFELVNGRTVILPLKLLRKRYCSNVVTSWISITPSPLCHDWRAFGDFLKQTLIYLHNQRNVAKTSISSADLIFHDSESESDINSDSSSSFDESEVEPPTSPISRTPNRNSPTQSVLTTPPPHKTRLPRSEPPPKRQKLSTTTCSKRAVSTSPPPVQSDSKSSEESDENTLTNLEIITRIRNYWRTPGFTRKSIKNNSPDVLKDEIHHEIVTKLLFNDKPNPAILKHRLANYRPFEKGCNVPDLVWPTMQKLLIEGGVFYKSGISSIFMRFDWVNLDDARMIQILKRFQVERKAKKLVSSVLELKVEVKLLASAYAYYLKSTQREEFDKVLEERKVSPISSGNSLLPYIDDVMPFNNLTDMYSEDILRHNSTKPWENTKFEKTMKFVFTETLKSLRVPPRKYPQVL